MKVLESTNQPFSENLVQQIIEDDFGGSEGIKLLEQEAILSSKITVNRIYMSELRNHFTRLNLVYNIAIFGLWFFIFKQTSNKESVLFTGYAPIIFICAGLIIGLIVNAVFHKLAKKRASIFKNFLFETSIKNNSFIAICATVFLILNYVLLLPPLILALITATLITLTSVNVRVFRKLNSNEAHLKAT